MFRGEDDLLVNAVEVARDENLDPVDGIHELHAAVVVKGAGSVLAYPDGTWDINASGNPGLASAGTGDVLAGFAGAFLAQGADARTALRIAVCVHGAAADECVRAGRGPLGLTAAELAPAARTLLNAAAGRGA